MLHATCEDIDGRHADISAKKLNTCIDKLGGNKQLNATVKKNVSLLVQLIHEPLSQQRPSILRVDLTNECQ